MERGRWDICTSVNGIMGTESEQKYIISFNPL